MGGCCCCLPRRTNRRTAEEHVPLSHPRPSSVVSAELEERNVETSARDISSATNFEFSSGNFHTAPTSPVIQSNINSRPQANTNSDSSQETLDESGIKVLNEDRQTSLGLVHTMKKLGIELPKTIDPLSQESIEEDACPICLEEYETENPKMFTKCNHHFHLACILEWMERSDICPICDELVVLLES